MEIVEARLEAALEGLPDAIHRQAVLHDEQIGELDRRTKPHQIARALSQDARKRGVSRALHGGSMTCSPKLAVTAALSPGWASEIANCTAGLDLL
jgi:hypothetical protein